MMNKLCAGCGKPVYFAERKTSLGKEWHRTCLRCTECGKVLSPGQHAEGKGLPYCHNPCYKALFGPSILGYGSNISSPANFARPDRPVSEGHAFSHGNGFKREIFSYQRSQSTRASQEVSRGVNGDSSAETSTQAAAAVAASAASSSAASATALTALQEKKQPSQKLQEVLQKVTEFNKYYDGKVHHQMTAEEKEDGSIDVKGPLRIYWGLSRPIQLVHCDNIPPAPISQWRHSLCVGPDSPDIPEKRFSGTQSLRRHGSPPHKTKELDDLFLTPSSPDDVVRRKKKVRKFKTVAYRGDQPTKWKRASINGHIFNFDTSVFTPVLGSCTSVTVDGNYNAADVIETLLDKFKVQNSPEEYVLSIVSEDGDRLLNISDKPLLERLKLGADESLGKIFIKERQPEIDAVKEDPSFKMPIVETAEEENLPYEVEQLLVLPEAVLRGILCKFRKDEEKEINLVKARYEMARKKIERRIQEMLTNQASSTA